MSVLRASTSDIKTIFPRWQWRNDFLPWGLLFYNYHHRLGSAIIFDKLRTAQCTRLTITVYHTFAVNRCFVVIMAHIKYVECKSVNVNNCSAPMSNHWILVLVSTNYCSQYLDSVTYISIKHQFPHFLNCKTFTYFGVLRYSPFTGAGLKSYFNWIQKRDGNRDTAIESENYI